MSKLPKQLKIDKLLSSASNSPSSTPTRSRSPSASSELPPKKKAAPESASKTLIQSENPTTSKGASSKTQLIEDIQIKRFNLFKSIDEFRFNKKRVRVLTEATTFPEDSKGILYWMSREQRVQDNWSLLYAQKLAIKQNLPLHVCFCLVPKFLGATYRHFYFMLEGLKEVEKELRELNITFNLLIGYASEQVPIFVSKNEIGGVICDFSPLRISSEWVNKLKQNLPPNIPMCQVDAHNIVPCWLASDKLEYAARTIRNKINNKLDEYLTEFPPLIKHPHDSNNADLASKVDWDHVFSTLECDKSVKKVDWATPGYEGGISMLDSFIKNRLKQFDEDRNDPNKSMLSNLSPWYHFGQISVQRAIIEIKKYNSKFSKSVQGYMEECIVRRELAENFCYYQPNYDNLEGANDWAKLTLELHAKDKRPYLYSLEQLDNFKTHDQLWNAAQIQMRVEGKMHGFLRMYWAKKILEWTESPAQALEYAIHLNDRYQLDGRDCAGYVGCMWSICGIHDQGWGERAVFGKIRYMNYEGCKRKFDIDRFIIKYNSKKSLV